MLATWVALSPIYFLCFIAMFAMARWYLLALGVVGAGAFLAWLMSGLDGANGPATFGIAMIVFPSFMGFVAGFLGRLGVMAMRRFSSAQILAPLIGLIAFVAGPLVATAYHELSEVRRKAFYAPPSESCLANPRPAALGGVALAIPLAPSISVDTGHGVDRNGPQDYRSIRNLESNNSAREFCADTAKGPIRLTELTVDFHRASSENPLCKRPSAYPWRDRACSRDEYGKRTALPDEVNYYAIGEYNARMMLAFDADNVNEIARLERSGQGQSLTGGVTRYEETHYTFFVKQFDVGTVVARCFKSKVRDVPEPEGLACVTGFRITPQVGVVAQFRASQATVLEDWQTVIVGTGAIWQSLLRHR